MTKFHSATVVYGSIKGRGYVTNNFSTVKIGSRMWSITHIATNQTIKALVSLNATTAKARIAALEAAFNWSADNVDQLLTDNGFALGCVESALAFIEAVTAAAIDINIIREK